MTHPHAKRRGVVPRPTEAHLALWMRVVKRAEDAARRPRDQSRADKLSAEASRAFKKAILPVGHQRSSDGPLMQLVRLSRAWRAMPDRAAKAGALVALATEARVIIEEARAGLHPRTRKDIDG